MTEEQMRFLHGLSINSGVIGLGLFRREEFAEYERAGWLTHDGNFPPCMRLTDAGRSALAAHLKSRPPNDRD